MKINRFLEIPKKSFLLLGPRGTGKSTLIRQKLKCQLEIDLLKSKSFLPLSSNPSLLEDLTKGLKSGSWIYIDEIQRIPSLMDEVHSLYENKKLHFALTGSSARKLKRGGANLLAGRALSLNLFPLTYKEYSSIFSLEDALQWGSLPQTLTQKEFRQDYLQSYVETYLREELIQEGLIRKLEPFVRFLNIVGVYSGQILNKENIARESHVGRATVEKYFEVLKDTLIGVELPPIQLKWNSKEFTHPKFYLFDQGVARACSGFLSQEIDPSWLGFAFETLVVNEVRAFNHYLRANKNLYYYKFSGGYEIDLIIENKRKSLSQAAEYTAIEIKLANRWDKRWNDPLLDIKKKSNSKVKKLLGVYRGKEILNQGEVEILPVEIFLTRLAQGDFF
jgi:predicted AAA+ superfamily ATPase